MVILVKTKLVLVVITSNWLRQYVRDCGVDRLLTVIAYSSDSRFFDIPVDHLMGAPLIADYFERRGMIGSGLW